MSIKLTWSFGEKPERSTRNNDKVALKKLNDANTESKQNAHTVCLNHDENTWNMMTLLNNGQNEQTTNREDLHFKISERQMVQQIGTNPFLQNDYTKDITNHNVFLVPKIQNEK